VKCNHNPKGKYNSKCKATQTSDKYKCKIRNNGGVSILCYHHNEDLFADVALYNGANFSIWNL
jgi:hypothetical protein